MLYQRHNAIGQKYFECLRYVDFKYVPHMHRHPELVRVAEGEAIMHYDGKTECVSSGEYALIPPNIVHACETAQHSLVDVFFHRRMRRHFFGKFRISGWRERALPAANQ